MQTRGIHIRTSPKDTPLNEKLCDRARLANLGWDRTNIIYGPGGILKPQVLGGWNPITLQYEAARDIVVVNKVDLAAAEGTDIVPLSARSGAGLPELLARLERSVGLLMEDGVSAPPLTRARHREALLEAHAALGRALLAPEIALVAEDLRLALRAIGRITGTVRVEELLDVIFRDFCIGK